MKINMKLSRAQSEIYDACIDPNIRTVSVCGGRKFGKALTLDTPIPTPNGWTTMGELQVGDIIFDNNGQPTTVTFVTETMYDHRCYRLTFNDGQTIVADADHQWVTQTHQERKNEKSRPHLPHTPQIHTTQEIYDTQHIGDRQDNNHSIQLSPVYGDDVELEIEPYCMGVWLGDGSSNAGVIWSDDQEVVDEVGRFYPIKKQKARFGYGITDGTCGGTMERRSNTFAGKLRSVGVLNNKHIPIHYLQTSYNQRLRLLQGLMDTDGCVDDKGSCEFCNTNEELTRGVLELVRSLGIRATFYIGDATLNGRFISKKYRIHFKTNNPVFLLPRKRDRQSSYTIKRRVDHLFVTSVEPTASVPVRCIQVDSPDHMYMCGDFIPTHNTRVALSVILDWALSKPKSVNGFFIPSYPYYRDQIRSEMQQVFPEEVLLGHSWDTGYSKSEYTVTLCNKSTIIFRSMDSPDTLRPVSLDALVAEEFSLWSEYAWVSCVQATLMAKKAKVLGIFTPKLKNHAHAFHMSEEPDHKAFHFTSYDGLVPNEEIDRLARSLSESAYQSEILAQWLDNLGRVFENIDNIINDKLPVHQEPHLDVPYIAGIDLGRVNDSTVITIFDDKTKIGVHQEDFKGTDYVKQSEKLAGILHKYNNAKASLDSTGDRGGVYELLKGKGCRVSPVVYTRKSKPELIDKLRIAITNGDFTIPHWHKTYEELAVFDMQETSAGNITYNAPAGAKDDHVNSLALAFKTMTSSMKRPSPSLIPRDNPVVDTKPKGMSIDTIMRAAFKQAQNE